VKMNSTADSIAQSAPQNRVGDVERKGAEVKTQKRKTKNQPRKDKRDQRKFEYAIAEKEKLVAERVGINREQTGTEAGVQGQMNEERVPRTENIAAPEFSMVDLEGEGNETDYRQDV